MFFFRADVGIRPYNVFDVISVGDDAHIVPFSGGYGTPSPTVGAIHESPEVHSWMHPAEGVKTKFFNILNKILTNTWKIYWIML